MTGNEKRDEIILEIRDLSKQLAEVEVSTLSSEMKNSCDRRLRTQVEKLIGVLNSDALADICT